MARKKSPPGKRHDKQRRTADWHMPRRSNYGRMVSPKELVAEYDRAARIRMADQEPVE